MNTVESIDLIGKNSLIRSGRPCIAGTGVRVTDVVIAHLFHNRTPSDVAGDYEISLAQVYAALAYYYEHKTALDKDIRQQIILARNIKENCNYSGNARHSGKGPVR